MRTWVNLGVFPRWTGCARGGSVFLAVLGMGACAEPKPAAKNPQGAAMMVAAGPETATSTAPLTPATYVAGRGPSFLPAARPKLVLVVALDQFRADYLTRFDSYFGDAGFKRLLREGAHWTGHYGHYVTYTGPGHALLLSGSYPYVNGIGANKFFNTETHRSEAMVFDAKAQIIGMKKTDTDMDVSPRNFVGSTVGDELFLATSGRSKTVALATKGRGAILLGGRLGKTYYLNDDTGEMTTSTYYGPELPAWAVEWNKKKFADGFFGHEWTTELPKELFPMDAPAHKADAKGLGAMFPHKLTGGLPSLGGAKSGDYYEAFTRTPFANDLEFDFAKAAVDGEKLGQRGVTDLLAISVSATDMAGHDYGPFSPEVADLVVKTDKQLGQFLDWIYGKFGRDDVLVLLSADHGATPVPEQMAELGFEAGRIKKKTLSEAIEAALTKKFGAPGGKAAPAAKPAKPANPGAAAPKPGKEEKEAKWVIGLEDPHVFLNRKLIEERKLDAAEVERVAGEAALHIKGFGGFFTRAQLVAGAIPQTDFARAIQRSYFTPRGGDLVLWTLPYYFWGKYGEKDQGTTHGTAYRYDAEVPVLLSGRGVKHGRYGVREQVDIAPTLSYLLGLTAPAGSEGAVVPVIE